MIVLLPKADMVGMWFSVLINDHNFFKENKLAHSLLSGNGFKDVVRYLQEYLPPAHGVR